MTNQDPHAAGPLAVKNVFAWLLVWLSHATPLDIVQFLAALAALGYTVASLFFLIRDKWWRDRRSP